MSHPTLWDAPETIAANRTDNTPKTKNSPVTKKKKKTLLVRELPLKPTRGTQLLQPRPPYSHTQRNLKPPLSERRSTKRASHHLPPWLTLHSIKTNHCEPPNFTATQVPTLTLPSSKLDEPPLVMPSSFKSTTKKGESHSNQLN